MFSVTEGPWWHITKGSLFSEPWISSHKMEVLASCFRPVVWSGDGKNDLQDSA